MLVSPALAWCGAGAFFFSISRVHQWITPLGMLQVTALLSVGGIALMLAAPTQWRPADLTKHWLTGGILIIAAIAVIGMPTSIYPGRSFTFFKDAYSRTLLLWVLGWAIARSAGGARFLARVLAAGGIGAAALTVMMNRRDSSNRLSGAYTYDPNDIALVCLMTFPLVLWWLIDTKKVQTKVIMALSLPILLYVIIKSGSRGGSLGLGTMALGIFLMAKQKVPDKVKKFSKRALLVSLLGLPLMPADYVSRIKTIGADEDDYNRTSETGRIAVWKRGIGYAFDHPLLGVGLANFGTAEGWYSEVGQRRAAMGRGWKWSTAHSSYVLVLAELGLIAGVLFPYLLIRVMLSLTRWHQRRAPGEPEDPLPSFLAVGLAAYMVSGAFLSFAYYDILYANLALAAGLLHPIRKRQRLAVPRPRAPVSNGRRVPGSPGSVPGRRFGGDRVPALRSRSR